jgi:prepilin signal peptidase PulO-like enzyme (type II secretory pathway)
MAALVAIPLIVRLLAIFVAGAMFGGLANWAIYRLAWYSRRISPWSPPPLGLPPRQWIDRLPVVGWLGMRREAAIHGRGFWVRPMLVELATGLGLAWLYWWEVARQSLVLGLEIPTQFGQIVALGAELPGWTAPPAVLHAMFLAHALLIVWMLAASFIDIDEKLIPDEIAVSGTLLGLFLATLLPLSLLPIVAERPMPPALGHAIIDAVGKPVLGPSGGPLYLESMTATAPAAWPDVLAPAPNWRSLVLGLGCYWFWCLALAPRIWRGRRGAMTALRLIGARVWRELGRPPLLHITLVGSVLITAVWWWAATGWIGLLTALVGMAGTGAFVWAVRIACSTALRVEALGFGDVTLMMMIGSFLGWQAGITIFFLAPIAGLVVGLIQFIVIRDNVIPYGPFLCLGALTAFVAWAPIWNRLQPVFEVVWLVPVALIVCLVLMWAMLSVWQAIKRQFVS